jgi:hypothetical protein
VHTLEVPGHPRGHRSGYSLASSSARAQTRTVSKLCPPIHARSQSRHLRPSRLLDSFLSRLSLGLAFSGARRLMLNESCVGGREL